MSAKDADYSLQIVNFILCTPSGFEQYKLNGIANGLSTPYNPAVANSSEMG
jgi:hypothetical protein